MLKLNQTQNRAKCTISYILYLITQTYLRNVYAIAMRHHSHYTHSIKFYMHSWRPPSAKDDANAASTWFCLEQTLSSAHCNDLSKDTLLNCVRRIVVFSYTVDFEGCCCIYHKQFKTNRPRRILPSTPSTLRRPEDKL